MEKMQFDNVEKLFQGVKMDVYKQDQVFHEITERIGKRFVEKTIENFEAKTPRQEEIKNKISAFINNIDENILSGRSMFFTGNRGNGKTHLAAAIYRAALEAGRTATYKLARQITREIKESWNDDSKSETAIINRYSGLSLLIIDEIGLDYGSETTLNIISEIFDNRYRNMKSTILIGNIENSEQYEKFIGPRIESRMSECGEVIYFDEKDFRKKKGE